jgi:hypothetical protein
MELSPLFLERIAAAEERGRLRGLAESERVLQERILQERLAAAEAIRLESERVLQERLAAAEESRRQDTIVRVMRQLKRKLNNPPSELDDRVRSLSIIQLEVLGDDLLDFTKIDDLLAWLSANEI